MKLQYKILIGVGTILLLGGITYILVRKKSSKKTKKMKNIIFSGGLDTRAGDKNISEQTDLVKKGLSKDIPVQSFRYTDKSGVLNAIDKNKDSYVLLFSAGCVHAESVAKKMKEKGGNLSNIYIIEPYHSGGSTTKSVQKAVQLGVPSKNVFVGKSQATGLGVVENTTPTPKCSPAHWCSVTEVAKIISSN